MPLLVVKANHIKSSNFNLYCFFNVIMATIELGKSQKGEKIFQSQRTITLSNVYSHISRLTTRSGQHFAVFWEQIEVREHKPSQRSIKQLRRLLEQNSIKHGVAKFVGSYG